MKLKFTKEERKLIYNEVLLNLVDIKIEVIKAKDIKLPHEDSASEIFGQGTRPHKIHAADLFGVGSDLNSINGVNFMYSKAQSAHAGYN